MTTSSSSKTSVRQSAVAGSFYPAAAGKLQRDVDELLQRATVPEKFGTIHGIVSPHAGYVYSGFTAAHSYKLLKGRKFDAVIIVGPSHREYFDGISIFPGECYQTPLGEVPINDKVRSKLIREDKGIVLSTVGHRTEHSVEVQLPFLQRALGSFSFVPVIMGDQSLELCQNLAEVMSSAISGQNVLLVASSDLSHYHTYDEAVSLDKRVIDLVESFDSLQLLQRTQRRELEACGAGPMVAVMLAARSLGANVARVIHYCNSGDVTGEKDAVVGYLSAMFTREAQESSPRVN